MTATGIKVQLNNDSGWIWSYDTDGRLAAESSVFEPEGVHRVVDGNLNVQCQIPFDGCEIGDLLDTWLKPSAANDRFPMAFHHQAQSWDARLIEPHAIRMVRTVIAAAQCSTNPAAPATCGPGGPTEILLTSIRELRFDPGTDLLTTWVDTQETIDADVGLVRRIVQYRYYYEAR